LERLNWEEIEYQILKILVDHIKQNDYNELPMSYVTLSNKLKSETGVYIHPHSVELATHLGNISELALDNGLPPISNIVINEKLGRPGNGYYKEFAPNLYSEDEKLKFFYKQLSKINEINNTRWNRFLEIAKDEYHVEKDDDLEYEDIQLENIENGNEEVEDEEFEFEEEDEPTNFNTGEERFANILEISELKQVSTEESIEHKRLKMLVANKPAIISINCKSQGTVEYVFPSGDRADIVIFCEEEIFVIEVELEGLNETKCGLFQAIKYKALMEALCTLREDYREVKPFLVAKRIPDEVKEAAQELNVMCVEISKE